MKAALESPAYLVRNHYSYCFRLTVPADLRKFVGRTELRFSYKTSLPEISPDLFPKQKESQPATEEQRSETIQHVLDAFWKENSPNWKKRTVTEYRTSHNHLIEFLGHDREIHTADYQDGRAYKEALSGTKTRRDGPMSPGRYSTGN
jgi:hypothetical protein